MAKDKTIIIVIAIVALVVLIGGNYFSEIFTTTSMDIDCETFFDRTMANGEIYPEDSVLQMSPFKPFCWEKYGKFRLVTSMSSGISGCDIEWEEVDYSECPESEEAKVCLLTDQDGDGEVSRTELGIVIDRWANN